MAQFLDLEASVKRRYHDDDESDEELDSMTSETEELTIREEPDPEHDADDLAPPARGRQLARGAGSAAS